MSSNLGTIKNPRPGKTRLMKFKRPLRCQNGTVYTHHRDIWIGFAGDFSHGNRGRWKYKQFLTQEMRNDSA